MRDALIVTLVVNATLALGYRLYRRRKGGPIADVYGGAALAALLGLCALLLGLDQQWVRWVALAYAVVFGIIALPIWVLAVFIPSDPRAADNVYLVLYWGTVLLIGVLAVLL